MDSKMERRQSVCLLGAFALSVLTLAGCSNSNATKTAKGEGGPEKDKDKAVAVKVVNVESRELRRTVESVGTIYAYDEVTLSPEVDGRVEKVLVDVGDHVTKGQTLVEILPIEYKLAVEQQQAMMDQAKAKLGLSDHDAELQDPSQAAGVKKAAADLANAKQKFERTKELMNQGLVPKQNYDTDEANYKAAQASYDLALQDVRNLQASLKQFGATRDLADKKLRDTHIVAPFDGYIKDRNVTVGQYLRAAAAAPTTPILSMVNINPVRVRLKIPEKMAGWIPVGQQVTVQVEAYPDRTFTGKIWRINPSVDPQTRTFDAEALIDNRDGALKPGFFVKSVIESNKVEHVLIVPQKALNYAYGIYKVFQVKGNKVKEAEVRLGDRMGDDVEVVQGLDEGAKLAVASADQDLKDGATIKQGSGGKKETAEAKGEGPTS
jgi:RND family efflux transporter MFP subunit